MVGKKLNGLIGSIGACIARTEGDCFMDVLVWGSLLVPNRSTSRTQKGSARNALMGLPNSLITYGLVIVIFGAGLGLAQKGTRILLAKLGRLGFGTVGMLSMG